MSDTKHCLVPGCARRVVAKGYCSPHWQRQHSGKPLDTPIRHVDPSRGCAVEGCDRKHGANGYCTMHMQRIRNTGSPGGAFIPLRPLRYAPGERRKQADGYVRVKPPGYLKPTLEHRHVMETVLGRKLLRQETVHHINGIRDDNRPENLELWVSCHNSGQRVEDLVDWILDTYPEYVEAALAGRAQLRLAG